MMRGILTLSMSGRRRDGQNVQIKSQSGAIEKQAQRDEGCQLRKFAKARS